MHDSRIKIDVRIQLARHKIIVLQRDFFQRHRQLEQGIILQAEFLQHLVAGFAHQLGARVVIFVHTMTKTHQPHIGILVLHLGNEFTDFFDAAVALDVIEHAQRGLIRPAMRRPPQARHAGGNGGKGIGAR